MIPGWSPRSHMGLSGFSEVEQEPAPVAAPMYGARTFTVRTFGKIPTGPLSLSAVLPYDRDRGVVSEHVLGGLHSIFMEQYRWSNRANRAICLLGPQATMLTGNDHGMPQRCSCGFWAYTSGEGALPAGRDAVWAVVQGWGRIVVGPKGFRAQCARIVAAVFPVILTSDGKMPMRWAVPRYPADVEHVTDPVVLKAALRTAYPSVDWCESVAAMYAKYPLSKLDPRMFADEGEAVS